MKSYRTVYPNQVHQLSVAVSKHYWVTQGGVLKFQQKPMEVGLDKLQEASRRHLVHYLVRDHFSGVVYSEIALSGCLTQLDEFLYRAWSEKENFLFCGIPDYMTLPQTVERAFPGVRERVSSLGVLFPDVTSGFQSGVRDIRTIEENFKFYVDRPLEEVRDLMNVECIRISAMPSRDGRQTKLGVWRTGIETVSIPPASWLAN